MNSKLKLLIPILTSGIIMSAQANTVVGAEQSSFTQLCVTAAMGNRAAMNNAVHASGYTLSFITKNVRCNDHSIMAFVERFGKNSESMLRILDRNTSTVSIIDIAQNRLVKDPKK